MRTYQFNNLLIFIWTNYPIWFEENNFKEYNLNSEENKLLEY